MTGLRSLWKAAGERLGFGRERRSPDLPRVYVVSKVRHAAVWRGLRSLFWGRVSIVSSWIDDPEIDPEGAESRAAFAEAWPRYLKEASSATHLVVVASPGEKLKGGLFEIGAGLAAGAEVFVFGEIEEMKSVRHHPKVRCHGPVADPASALVAMVESL